MAINDIVQTVAEARVDARSLSEFVFKPSGFKVARRLAPTIDTLQFYINRFNSLNGDFSSSVSVALSSLNNSVAEAEGKVVYIEATVQDAINNTAIEGGVLADTFVVVDGSLSQRTINKGLESIADLSTIQNPKDGLRVYVKSYHADKNKGGGDFIYDASLVGVNDGGNIINGWVRQGSENYLNAFNFGAVADSVDTVNDHVALRRMAAIINNADSGSFVVHLPSSKGKYLVGKQYFVAGTGFVEEDPFNISKSTMQNISVILKSDNAKVRVNDGMYFGTFNKDTKDRYDPSMPFYPNTSSWIANGGSVTLARIGYIFSFRNIKTLIVEGSLEIDGNRHNAVIGGRYGDSGWQIPAYGFRVYEVERFSVSNVTAFDHLLDGIYIAGCNPTGTKEISDPNFMGVLRNVTSTLNSRQGISVTGGQNISFYDCHFADIGTSDHEVSSLPRAACDIEAEINPVRNLRFYNCFFGEGGSSLVADSGDISGVTFYNCEFINAKGSVLWVRKPQFKFHDCYINGFVEAVSMVGEDATVFNGCVITTDPKRNPSYTRTQYSFITTSGQPVFNDTHFDFYGGSGIYISSGSAFATFNDTHFTYYKAGAYGNMNVTGNGTVQIIDKRPDDERTTVRPIFSGFKGIISIDVTDGKAINVIPYGKTYSQHTLNTPKSAVYNVKVAGVGDAVATDDTAQKLNALIANMKAAGVMA